MADLAKVKRNIQRMIDQKASEPEIDSYVKSEGTTPEELQGAKASAPTPSWSDLPAAALNAAPASAGKLAGGIVEGLGNAVAHPVDTFKSVVDQATGLALNIPGAQALNDYANKNITMFSKRTPADIANDQNLKAQGAATIANKTREYTTSEGFRQKAGNDPFSIVGDALTVASPELIGRGAALGADVAKGAVRRAKVMNKLDVTYPEAAQAVASDLKNLHDNGGYNLNDVSSSNQGAKGAVTKASIDNTSIIKDRAGTVKDLLNGDVASLTPEQRALREQASLGLNASQESVDLAEQAIASGKQKTASHATPEQIKAVDQLTGHTQQGADLVHALKKHVELNRRYDQIHGGVSKYTDVLNPFADTGGRLVDQSMRRLTLGGGLFYGAHFNPMVSGAMAAVPIAGHVVDKITGRKSLPQLFMKQNLEGPKRVIDTSLTDVVAEAAKKSDALQSAKDAQAETIRQARASAKSKQLMDQYHKAQDSKVTALGQKFKSQDAQSVKDAAVAAAKQKQLSDAALAAIHRKMTVQANVNQAPYSNINTGKIVNGGQKPLAKVITEAKKSEDKANAKIKSSSAPSNILKDAQGNAIRNLPAYTAKTSNIQALEKDITSTATSHPNPHVAELLKKAVDEFRSDRGKGIDDQGKFSRKNRLINRATILNEILHEAKSPHEKDVLRKHLEPLKDVFK